jgi:CRISPR-associated protein Cas1
MRRKKDNPQVDPDQPGSSEVTSRPPQIEPHRASAQRTNETARPDAGSRPSPVPLVNGTLTLVGYGLVLDVDNGRLRVKAGMFDKQESLFDKADGIQRVVAIGRSGLVTLRALGWLHDSGASFVQFGTDGSVLTASAPHGTSDPRLVRAQSLALFTSTGLELTRWLLRQKLRGQGRIARGFGSAEANAVADRIDVAAETLDVVPSLDGLRSVEAVCAASYWGLWQDVKVNFSRRDRSRVNPRWLSFGARVSPLSQSERRAASAANSLLNYAYGILTGEMAIALQVAGLNPSIAVLHADQRGRDSFALDVVEPLRPEVDEWLLGYLRQRTFSKVDFAEAADGSVHCSVSLARELTAMAPTWRRLIAPLVEQVARLLMDSYRPDVRLPLNLTGARRRAAGFGYTARPTTSLDGGSDYPPRERRGYPFDQTTETPAPTQRVKLVARCVECGTILTGRQARFCSVLCRMQHNRAVRPTRYSITRDGERAALTAHGQAETSPGEARRSPLVEQDKRSASSAAERQARPDVLTSSPASDAIDDCDHSARPTAMVDDARSASPVADRSSERGFSTGVTTKRKQATADKARERVAWESAHPEVNLTAERQRYETEIRPRLASATCSIRDLADALGLSPAYAARIRSGETMPHPRYFPKLVELLGV